MGMTVTACYIFLAIVLAPPLVKAGLDPLAVHLFIMYWGMVSFITPPVALATFAAAPLAGVSAMRIGLQSMRLGTAIYFVPFCFVLNPALLMKGEPATRRAGYRRGLCRGNRHRSRVAGLCGRASGLIPTRTAGWAARAALIAGGIMLAAPSPRLTGLSFGGNLTAGAAATLLGLLLLFALAGRARTGRTIAMKCYLAFVAAALIATPLAPAAAQSVKLPETLTWTAYDVGSGGYNQSVAIGNALKNKLQRQSARSARQERRLAHGAAARRQGAVLGERGRRQLPRPGRRIRIRRRAIGVRSRCARCCSTIPTLCSPSSRRRDANIKTMADLKGKRVAWVVGAPSLNQNITALLASARPDLERREEGRVRRLRPGDGRHRQQPGRRGLLLDDLRPGLQDRVLAARRALSDRAAQRQGGVGAHSQDRAVLRAVMGNRRRRPLQGQQGGGGDLSLSRAHDHGAGPRPISSTT